MNTVPVVAQHEGGEQGDPLVPLLFSLAVHNSLCEMKRLREHLFAFLDDACAWQVLVQCAGPKCHHLLRTMPPHRSLTYSRLPELAAQIVHNMSEAPAGCLGDLQETTNVLDHCGFVGRPPWEELRQGARPGPYEAARWPHGWQYFASTPTCAHTLEPDVQKS